MRADNSGTSSPPPDTERLRPANAPSQPCAAWTKPERRSPSTPSPSRPRSPGPGSTTSQTYAPKSNACAPEATPRQQTGRFPTSNAPPTPHCCGDWNPRPSASSNWRPTTSNCAKHSHWPSDSVGQPPSSAAPTTRRERNPPHSSDPADGHVEDPVLITLPLVKTMITSPTQDNGRKRHIAVDTCGLLLMVLVTGAAVQDRDGGQFLLWALATCFRRVRLVWVDGGGSWSGRFPGSAAAAGPYVTMSDNPSITRRWCSGPWSSS